MTQLTPLFGILQYVIWARPNGKALEEIIKDRKQLRELIHSLIYQIVFYARPKEQKDVIAGRKKDDQMIPSKLTST